MDALDTRVAEAGRRAVEPRGDALGAGLPGDVFPAVDPRPVDGSPEVSRFPEACPRLAVWPQVAWFLVAWFLVAWLLVA